MNSSTRKRLEARSQKLSFQQPHSPPGHEHAAKEEHETIEPVPDHVARVVFVSDAKHNRRKHCKDKRRTKMIEMNGQFIPTCKLYFAKDQ